MTNHTSYTAGPRLQIGSAAGFQWNVAELAVASLPRELDGLRILQLSDLHMRPRWSSAYDRIIDRVADDPPDLVLITGDFVENKVDPRPTLPYVERLVTSLHPRFGISAVLGNHDGHLLGPHLARWNLRFLDYQLASIPVGGATIELIGLEGVVRQDLSVDRVAAFPPKPSHALRIVMSHYPDAILRAGVLRADFFFAGHTHGGQICLPGGRPIITHDALPRPYASGIHRFDDTWLIVNRGLGFAGIPVRLFCPAEVIEVKVVKKEP